MPMIPAGIPVVRGRLAPLSSTVTAIEENPEVDVQDIVRSVIETTAGAIPWVHAAASAAARVGRGAPRERSLADALAALDAEVRPGVASPSSATMHVDQTTRLTVLGIEVVRFIGELLTEPLFWMLGAVGVMAGGAVAIVRGRGAR